MGVRINIGHLEGKQPEHGELLTQIRISDADHIFVPVATFLVSLLSLGTLAETYNKSGSRPWAADDYISLDASAASSRLFVQGQPIASAVVLNRWPNHILIGLAVQPNPYDGTSHLGEFGPYLFSAMQGMFTAFYEEHVATISATYGSIVTWPAVWKFGRIVRNALSHGGNLRITKPTTASWRSLSYTQSDHLRPVILADLWPGDLILLLKEMQGALPERP
jgi:hypothetical protein